MSLCRATNAKGLRIEDVRDALKCQWHTIKDYENGKYGPSRSRLLALAKLYGVDPRELEAEEVLERDESPNFKSWLETYPLGRRLAAGEVLGVAEDKAIIGRLRAQDFLGGVSSAAVYDELARAHVDRGREKAAIEPPVLEPPPVPTGQKPLKKVRK